MKIILDNKNDFNKDLDNLVSKCDRYKRPLIVLPTERDTKIARKNYIEDAVASNITFISYDYWLSKKWIIDDNYDHIDFFRLDQFFINRSFGTKVGVGTIRKIVNKEEKNDAQ